ncbi:MAG: DUF2905 domain-containing protein [Desulfuromonadaceae bacterium]|nr:DUF2905 domain-containing protein [Desulfuromonadaceae bacterium]
MTGLGQTLIRAGIILLVVGLLVSYAPKLPTWLGRLPGDISFKHGSFSFYVPLGTCLLLSALFSLLMWILRK